MFWYVVSPICSNGFDTDVELAHWKSYDYGGLVLYFNCHCNGVHNNCICILYPTSQNPKIIFLTLWRKTILSHSFAHGGRRKWRKTDLLDLMWERSSFNLQIGEMGSWRRLKLDVSPRACCDISIHPKSRIGQSWQILSWGSFMLEIGGFVID